MVSPKCRSGKAAAQSAKRQSDMFSDTEAASEAASESEYVGNRSRLRRHRKNATSIGRRLVKRRRVVRTERGSRAHAPGGAVTPPSSSSPQGSSDVEVVVERKEGECEYSQGPPAPSGLFLRWKNIPYPGLPQIGYAFSYASGAVCFLKVPASASKFLGAHWRSPQNYAAYVIYSLHRLPEMDNKLQGLEMVNELAAYGFLEADDCNIHEEIVQCTRTLSFQRGDVMVNVPKLGDAKSFKGYRPGSKVDEEDRSVILAKLQSVMHDRALLHQQTSGWTACAASGRCSDKSRVRDRRPIMSSENEGGSPASSGNDACLADSGLIKFVKVHWKQSKWIVDNFHLIRSRQQCSSSERRSKSESTGEEEDDFKAVVVWSNKAEKKQGINLLEKMIAAQVGGQKNDDIRGVIKCEEVMDSGETWLVYHNNDVVVGFPGRDGDNKFVASIGALVKSGH